MKSRFLYRLFGDKYDRLGRKYFSAKTRVISTLKPYRFDADRYKGTFLVNDVPADFEEDLSTQVKPVIYVFWTGDNELTPNRKKGIESLEMVSGVEVKLITPKNLNDYIIDDDPLPEAYPYLSLVHKSDYLRSYFMHHHGGGYADIKTYFHSWVGAFSRLNTSDAYAIGYREPGYWTVANIGIEHQALKDDLRNYWHLLIGNCAFICRPHTKLTTLWHEEAKKRVNKLTEELKKHPAKDPCGTNKDYPIAWENLQGEIFHPLCLKFHDKLLADNALKPSFKNYR